MAGGNGNGNGGCTSPYCPCSWSSPAALPFPPFPVSAFVYLLSLSLLRLFFAFTLLFCLAFSSALFVCSPLFVTNPARSVDLCQQPALLLLQFRLLWALLIRVQFLVLLLQRRHACALFALEERPIIAAIDADTCRGKEYQSVYLVPPSSTYLGRWAAARRCWRWPTWRCICRLHHSRCLRSTLAGLKRG